MSLICIKVKCIIMGKGYKIFLSLRARVYTAFSFLLPAARCKLSCSHRVYGSRDLFVKCMKESIYNRTNFPLLNLASLIHVSCSWIYFCIPFQQLQEFQFHRGECWVSLLGSNEKSRIWELEIEEVSKVHGRTGVESLAMKFFAEKKKSVERK